MAVGQTAISSHLDSNWHPSYDFVPIEPVFYTIAPVIFLKNRSPSHSNIECPLIISVFLECIKNISTFQIKMPLRLFYFLPHSFCCTFHWVSTHAVLLSWHSTLGTLYLDNSVHLTCLLQVSMPDSLRP